MVCFWTFARFCPAPVVFFSLSTVGHAGGPPVHHGASLGPERAPWRVLRAFKVQVPSRLRGACSGRSCPLFCSTASKALYLVPVTVQEQQHIKFISTTTTMHVWTLHMRVLCSVCAMIRVRLCRCVQVCVLVHLKPHIQLRVFLLCLLLLLLPLQLLLPYHVVWITPFVKLSSPLLCGSHGTTVAQQMCGEYYLLAIRVLT